MKINRVGEGDVYILDIYFEEMESLKVRGRYRLTYREVNPCSKNQEVELIDRAQRKWNKLKEINVTE